MSYKGGDCSRMSFDTIKNIDIVNYIGKEDTIIIDLRERYEYKLGHIPTAINIPYICLDQHLSKLKGKKQIIFYCERGNISLLAARDLIKEGYNIKSLYGGIKAYKGKLVGEYRL